MSPKNLAAPFVFALLFGCGPNVFVDQSASGGAGGGSLATTIATTTHVSSSHSSSSNGGSFSSSSADGGRFSSGSVSDGGSFTTGSVSDGGFSTGSVSDGGFGGFGGDPGVGGGPSTGGFGGFADGGFFSSGVADGGFGGRSSGTFGGPVTGAGGFFPDTATAVGVGGFHAGSAVGAGGSSSGSICGGLAGRQCPPSTFCHYASMSCGGNDDEGVCEPMPTDCQGVPIADVCACNGATYQSACVANLNGSDVAADSSRCVNQAPRACGPSLHCQPSSQYCLETFEADSGESYTCVDNPPDCSSCMCVIQAIESADSGTSCSCNVGFATCSTFGL